MKAHAPGSITGFFVPPAGADSAARGASVAIADGVVVEVTPAPDTAISVAGTVRSFDPVERVLDRLGVTATVAVTPEVPIGCGFGASGAATLATALAANATVEAGYDRDALVRAAHEAEVAAGTGLGDVFIQNRGGMIWSTDTGTDRAEPDAPIEYTAFDGLATEDVLDDDRLLDRLRRHGETAFDRLPDRPSLRRLVELSWRFARDSGLATDRVAREIDRVEDAGGAGSMAMLGESVFAVGVTDVLQHRTRVSHGGARLLED